MARREVVDQGADEPHVVYTLLAPAGTPKAILQRLSREVAATMRSPEATARYGAMGAETIGSTPEEFARVIRADAERWGGIGRKLGVQLD